MSGNRFIRRTGILTVLTAFLAVPATTTGQVAAGRQEPATSKVSRPGAPDAETIQSIDDDFDRELLAVERRRLERLERLASRQQPADADATYEKLFRLAVDANLFREAEPAAKAVLAKGSESLVTVGLAHLVKIVAEADRGDYDQSLESLRQAVAERDAAAQSGSRRVELPIDEVVEICDAYYQRLIQNAQYENARKALTILLGSTQRPELKAFVSSRLRRLDLVGKPAPAIRGTDLDHRPFDLADARGKVVLVVFWASWCEPCAAEIESLHELDVAYRTRGLKIVGINLDTLSEGGQASKSTLANVRHFLLEYNVRWPTLINGQGETDYAKAYGVAEIPANVLVDRTGTVVQIDLASRNLDSMVARAVGR